MATFASSPAPLAPIQEFLAVAAGRFATGAPTLTPCNIVGKLDRAHVDTGADSRTPRSTARSAAGTNGFGARVIAASGIRR
jgi:hypothetical protein